MVLLSNLFRSKFEKFKTCIMQEHAIGGMLFEHISSKRPSN
jgi:hypothetical protein